MRCCSVGFTMTSLFKWKRSLNISNEAPVFKVRYLGNVQTALMKGDGCVDKPVSVIWNNYVRNPHPGLEMTLQVTSSGMSASTKEQGLTEYRAHRLSYFVAHEQHAKLFVWVYRHEGKKMKLELRCHAVLCKTEAIARSISVVLHEKIDFALKEFKREKTRKQNSRLALQRAQSLPNSTSSNCGSFVPLRKQMLNTGQNYKPPISKSNTAPKLGAITEDNELQSCYESEEETEQSESDLTDGVQCIEHNISSCNNCSASFHIGDENGIIDISTGNDISALKNDIEVRKCLDGGDSDDGSSESGFHEQDSKEGLGLGDVDDLSSETEVCELPIGSQVDSCSLSSDSTSTYSSEEQRSSNVAGITVADIEGFVINDNTPPPSHNDNTVRNEMNEITSL